MKINFGTSKVSFSHFFKGFNSHFLVIENYASQKYALQGFNTQAATLPIQFFLAAFVGSLDFSIDFILLSLPHLKQCVPYVFYGECMETNPPPAPRHGAVGYTGGFRRAFALRVCSHLQVHKITGCHNQVIPLLP